MNNGLLQKADELADKVLLYIGETHEDAVMTIAEDGSTAQELRTLARAFKDAKGEAVDTHAATVMTRRAAEGCKLVAHNTGDGWALLVEDGTGEVVAHLEWPKAWPEAVSAKDLREIGFEIV